MHYTFIDPLYLSGAEKEISASVTNFKIRLDYENENELIVIPPNLEEEIKEKYVSIGRKYVGFTDRQIERNKELQHELETTIKAYENKIEKIMKDSTIAQNLSKAEIGKKESDSTIAQNLLKAEIGKKESDSTRSSSSIQEFRLLPQ